jgi:hypothetical protein
MVWAIGLFPFPERVVLDQKHGSIMTASILGYRSAVISALVTRKDGMGKM